MDSIVEVDAGEDGEDVSLQERDQQFEHFQRDMARQHIREQSHRMRNRLQEERYDLDEHHQRQDVDRHTRGHEQLEEFQAVLVQAVEQHDEEHQQRQRGGDDEMA